MKIGIHEYEQDFATEVTKARSAELLDLLVRIEHIQASRRIMRLTASTRVTSVLRTLPSSITARTAETFDALVQCALASIIAGNGPTYVGAGEWCRNKKADTCCWGVKHRANPAFSSARAGLA